MPCPACRKGAGKVVRVRPPRAIGLTIERWALEEIVQKESPLHEQDLAKLVSSHFSDVLQQIQDRDLAADGEDASEAADAAKARA